MKLATKVYWDLKREIATSELLPGTSLHELDLCEKWGVSRTPVREALKMLAAEGLVESRRGSGYSVAQISRQDVIEAYQVRIWLEPPLAAAAARVATADVIERLRSIVEQTAIGPFEGLPGKTASDTEWALQEELHLAREKRQLWTGLDADFHTIIGQAAGNSLANTFVQHARLVTQRASYLIPPGRLRHSNDEHHAILLAISSRDEKGAEGAMRDHLNSTYRRLYTVGWMEMGPDGDGD